MNTTSSQAISTDFQALTLVLTDILIIVGNIFTMLTAWKLRKKPLVVDLFIFALASVDVLNALTSVTIAAWMRFWKNRQPEQFGRILSFCQAQAWCTIAFQMTSVFLVSLISLERCLAVSKPFLHRQKLTQKRARHALETVSLISVAVATLPLLGWDSYKPLEWLALCLYSFEGSYAAFLLAWGYSQLLVVMCSTIATIYSLGKFCHRQKMLLIARHSSYPFPSSNRTKVNRRRTTVQPNLVMRQSQQLARVCLLVVVCFYASYLPLVVRFRNY